MIRQERNNIVVEGRRSRHVITNSHIIARINYDCSIAIRKHDSIDDGSTLRFPCVVIDCDAYLINTNRDVEELMIFKCLDGKFIVVRRSMRSGTVLGGYEVIE